MILRLQVKPPGALCVFGFRWSTRTKAFKGEAATDIYLHPGEHRFFCRVGMLLSTTTLVTHAYITGAVLDVKIDR